MSPGVKMGKCKILRARSSWPILAPFHKLQRSAHALWWCSKAFDAQSLNGHGPRNKKPDQSWAYSEGICQTEHGLDHLAFVSIVKKWTIPNSTVDSGLNRNHINGQVLLWNNSAWPSACFGMFADKIIIVFLWEPHQQVQHQSIIFVSNKPWLIEAGC